MTTISASAPPVFITVPKYVAITPNTAGTPLLPKIRISSPAGQATPPNFADDATTKGKKRRLDHLSWEEKIQRKKLKNRVAAQTSRDRKKARMEDMEHEIRELTQRTEMLQNKCESMQAINESLLEKNHKLDLEVELLRQQLIDLQQQKKEQVQQPIRTITCAGCESILKGSAVSTCADNPLQQGSIGKMDSQSAEAAVQLQKTNTLAALWRIVTLCLLYKTCSPSTSSAARKTSLMLGNWKNLPKACSQISPQVWKQVMERAMKLLPKLQAKQNACLDQWWGPQQSCWNPANILESAAVTA